MSDVSELPVIVAGAGYSGDRLAAALRTQGCRVMTLSRQPRQDTDHVPWNPDDGAALALPTARYRIAYLVPPAPGDPEPRLAAFLAALPEAPERIVLASTSGVYGDCNGELVAESRPVNPSSKRAEQRVVQERTLSGWAAERGSKALILRIAGIYGPGRLPIERLARGETVIRREEAHPGNRIHVDDLVATLLAALGHPTATGVFNVADGNDASGTEFYGRVAALAGLPAPQEISRAEAQATFTAQRYSFLADSRRLDVSRLRDVLGVRLKYTSLDEGIRASL
ncbi:MAG: NAD-dependent epimerase/dehydratase family protein [Pseudomonadota bacterium]